MSTKENLELALKNAMREGNETRKRAIRLALAAIKMAEIDQGSGIEEPSAIAIVQKEIKARQESIEAAKKGGRDDLIEAALAEQKVLEEFLPAQLSDDEIMELAKCVIAEVNASTKADIGKVMKPLLAKVQGRAANNKVSEVVRNLLND